MKFLVLGGAGYIGSHFVYEARLKGHECLVFDDLSRGHKQALLGCAKLVKANILDTDQLSDVVGKFQPDVILHYAAYALVSESVKYPKMYMENNVGGVRSLVNAMQQARYDCPIIFSSSCVVFGIPTKLPIAEDDPKDPLSPYGESKLESERVLREAVSQAGFSAMAMRYFNACGAHPSGAIGEHHDPETHLIPNVLLAAIEERPFKLFGSDYDTKDGTCVRDYIHVVDLADAHLKAAEFLISQRDAKFYQVHLGTGRGYSNLEIVKTCEKVVGSTIKYKFADRRAGDPPALYTDNQRAQDLLGFFPQHSDLETIVETAWRWHRDHPNGFAN